MDIEEDRFERSIDFWKYVKELIPKLMKKQLGDVYEGSIMYTNYIYLLNRIEGCTFIKPNLIDYYSLDDNGITDSEEKIRDRKNFIWAMKTSDDVISHLSQISRTGYCTDRNNRSRSIFKDHKE